jgi:dCTP deaminase
VSYFPDKAIREAVWPTNGARPTVYVPDERAARFGWIDPSQVQPISLDVRLSNEFISHPGGNAFAAGEPGGFRFMLEPGECVLGSTIERFDLRADNVGAQVHGKSTLAREFLTVHAAGLIDPGFLGDITLEIKNDGHKPVELQAGMRIAQVQFYFLAGSVDRLYGDKGLESHYQWQSGPTASAREV